MTTFRQLRILFLLLVLLVVAMGTWLAKVRTTSWDKPLAVVLYPINADHSAAAKAYISGLKVKDFHAIEEFFSDEAGHYGVSLVKPVEIDLGPVLKELPPPPPEDRNIVGVMWWSLKVRYWAWQIRRKMGPPAQIQIFVLYHDPANNPRLAHSLGLQKGLLGVVHAFASAREAGGNQVVIAHELLHTLGATDKYDMRTNLPLYPIGYAEPEREPLYPQALAEIMAGRIPLSAGEARQAYSLNDTVVGEYTAREIRWIK